MYSNLSKSPETANLGQIRRFLEPCDLEIWRMTLKNNRAPLQCYFKLCASFLSHWWIQTWVTVWERPFWVKFDDFYSRVTLKFDGWPWKIIGHLFYATSSFVHHFVAIGDQAICIISSSYVNSNWSYSPETVKLGCDLCDLDLWPWPFAWTLCWSLVIMPENFMMIRWWEHSQKGVTDRRTDRRKIPFVELLGRS